ncbi:lysozyme [Microvirga alba]|uniref:Lysozyme n=1 Tax=Microvirga alba TaxID=2791025 RepID=A0A931BTR9_9HYPH|nr:lysozyme [Microvirga alba]MBF9235569.1 lysozyme [Microvirga alba]
MQTSEAGIALVKQFEGFRAKPYRCPAGIPTIGYGATFYPDGRKVQLTDPPITETFATEMLRNMLGGFERGVLRHVAVPLAQHEFDALVSFAYNLGTESLPGSTLLKKLNAGDKRGAADQLLRWNRANGQVMAGLTRRREAERAMFLGKSNAAAA